MRIQRAKLALIAFGLAIAGLVLLGGPLRACDPVQQVPPDVAPITPMPQLSSTPTPTVGPSSPTGTPTAQPVATLCRQVDVALVRREFAVATVAPDPAPPRPEIGLPSYDACSVRLGRAANRPIAALRIGLSVLPATAADLASARKAYDAGRGRFEASQPVNGGGFATSTLAVVLAGDRLVKVSGPVASVGAYAALARALAGPAAGLPAPPALITRPECDRGSAAAADVLGAPAAARRDSAGTAGTDCAWITGAAVVSSSARAGAPAVGAFEAGIRSPDAEPVPLGDEAYVDTRTDSVHVRSGSRIASIVALPAGRAGKAAMLALALAISPVYTR